MKRIFDFLVKVLSLGIGLAIAMILIAKVTFEISYDGFYNDADRIYRIETDITQQGDDKTFANVSGAIAPGFKDEVPGVEEATRYTPTFDSDVFYDESDNKFTAQLLCADSCFFKVFDRSTSHGYRDDFLAGDPVSALKSWDGSVSVSRSIAERLGGVEEALGKTFYHESAPDIRMTVTGVYEDFPANSSVAPDCLISLYAMGNWSISNWLGNDRYSAFVKLGPGVKAKSLDASIRKMQEAHQDLELLEKNGTSLRYTLNHFSSRHRNLPDVKSMIIILSIVALLLLLVSVMNYVLFDIGDVLRRSREMGVRKCFGASNSTVYTMLFKETAINMLCSLIISGLLILAFKRQIETLIGIQITSLIIPQTWYILGCILTVVFLTSTLIPARMFIKIPISSAFRGYKESKRHWKLSLLSLQIAFNAMLLSLMLIVNSQYHKCMSSDPGYDYKNLAYTRISSLDYDGLYHLAEELRNLPEVDGAELAYTLPFWTASGNNVRLPGEDKDLFNIADEDIASEGFCELMGIRLIEGNFPKLPREVAVSRSFVDKMNMFQDWTEGAIGKNVIISGHSYDNNDFFTICGVYEDHLIGSFETADQRPSVHFCNKGDWENVLVVKFREMNNENIAAANTLINRIISNNSNGHSVYLTSYADTFRSLYNDTNSLRRTFLLGAIFAILIAIMGLIAYVRDESQRRSAEIAVRKVNGAQTSQIVKMLVINIIKLAGLAVVIGNIGAWLTARDWLSQFPKSVNPNNPWFYLIADAIILALVTLTIIQGSIKIASTNPAESLKRE